MKIQVNGHDTFISTGGRNFDPNGEVLLFIHGSGQSHLSFLLQGRFLANRGFDVLVPDMPAHGLSKGDAPQTIEEMADWYVDVINAAEIKGNVNVIGHSQGGLVAMEMARRHPEKVKMATFIATALAIPVNDMLLDLAKNKEPRAIDAMMDWGHGPAGHMHDHTMPGHSHLAYGRQLMSANEAGALFTDLSACAAYTDGAAAAAAVQCPSLCIFSDMDKMTPIKAGRKLADALSNVEVVELKNAGHMSTTERPFEVNIALRKFLAN